MAEVLMRAGRESSWEAVFSCQLPVSVASVSLGTLVFAVRDRLFETIDGVAETRGEAIASEGDER